MTTPYASGRVLVWTVVAFLILAMLLHLGGLISDFQLIGVHAGQKGLYRLDIGRRDLYLVFSAATLLAALGTYALASIALVAWLRNSYRNLVALGGTPRYAMWWPLAAFFVPFVNVLRPYEMVTEICANARPLMRGNAKPVPPLVPWWWAVTLLAGLAWLAWLYGALAFGNRVGVIEVRVLAGLLTLVSAALTVSIVQTISQMQDDSWEGRFLPAPAQEGRWRHLDTVQGQPAELELAVTAGLDTGKVFPLIGGEITIGRMDRLGAPPWGSIAVQEPSVSRMHAVLNWNAQSNVYTVQHRSKTNLTVLNGRSIGDAVVPLTPGDHLRLGRLEMVVRLREVAPPPPLTGPVAAGAPSALPATTTRIDEGQVPEWMLRPPGETLVVPGGGTDVAGQPGWGNYAPPLPPVEAPASPPPFFKAPHGPPIPTTEPPPPVEVAPPPPPVPAVEPTSTPPSPGPLPTRSMAVRARVPLRSVPPAPGDSEDVAEAAPVPESGSGVSLEAPAPADETPSMELPATEPTPPGSPALELAGQPSADHSETSVDEPPPTEPLRPTRINRLPLPRRGEIVPPRAIFGLADVTPIAAPPPLKPHPVPPPTTRRTSTPGVIPARERLEPPPPVTPPAARPAEGPVELSFYVPSAQLLALVANPAPIHSGFVLEALDGTRAGQVIGLERSALLLGRRLPDVDDQRIGLDDPYLPREHAVLLWEPQTASFSLHLLEGSLVTTRVMRGETATTLAYRQPLRLRAGDVVEAGDSRLRLQAL